MAEEEARVYGDDNGPVQEGDLVECSLCSSETRRWVEEEMNTKAGVRRGYYCRICYSTYIGNILAYPGIYNAEPTFVQGIAQIGNMLLDAIEANRTGGS